MDKSNKYDLTKFSVFISFFICDNKNEGLLLHKGNHLLLVSAILYYIPFFRISVFFFFCFIVYHASYQQLTNNISLL